MHWGGVDGWKEDRQRASSAIHRAALATLTIDMPGTGEAPVKIVFGRRRNLCPIDGDELCIHSGQRYWLIAVVSDYEEYGHEAHLAVVNRKDACLIGHIVRIKRQRNRFTGMLVVCGIAFRWLRCRHDKMLSRQAND